MTDTQRIVIPIIMKYVGMVMEEESLFKDDFMNAFENMYVDEDIIVAYLSADICHDLDASLHQHGYMPSSHDAKRHLRDVVINETCDAIRRARFFKAQNN